MQYFITGAGGYIGGSIAARLVAQGHRVTGLVRDSAKVAALQAAGITPVIGSLDDHAVLTRAARECDGVINAANADHRPSVQVLLAALAGTGKPLLHTSGSSVVGDDARGNALSVAVFDEDTPFVVQPLKQARHALNQMILDAAEQGVRSAIICPTLIYGQSQGVNPSSIQIPFLVEQARLHGAVRVVGLGLNRWSTVHIDDLTDLYVMALEKAVPGAFFFAENGESSFSEIGEAIAARLGFGAVTGISAEIAAAEWGEAKALYTFGSNSRVRAKRARAELGWAPRHASAQSWIRYEMLL